MRFLFVVIPLLLAGWFPAALRAQTPPGAVTDAATGVGMNEAVLNGTIQPNGQDTTVTFEFGPTVSYGASVAAQGSPVSGSTPQAVYVLIQELLPGTTYHFRVVAVNASGTTYGSDRSLTTLMPTPLATTGPASGVGPGAATLNGTVNARGASTTVFFEYGTADTYGSSVAAAQSPVSGWSDTAVSRSLGALIPGSTYHYRVAAQNSGGTVYGADMTFVAGYPPTIFSSPAAGIGATQATLQGLANANGAESTVYFEYGVTAEYGRSVPADQSPVTGSSNTALTALVADLMPKTTYHFRAAGQNASGTSYGSDLTFTTAGALPQAVTGLVTGITSTGAVLNGMVNANQQATTVTFEYGLTASYGTTVAAVPGSVSGASPVAVSQSIGGLTENTTYHFRVVAQNAEGISYGSDEIFLTTTTPPTAITTAASGVGGTFATLNGTVNANNNTTLAACEYGPSTAYGRSAAASQNPVRGSTATAVSCPVTDLVPGTTYHYRVVAQNGAGAASGEDATLVTGPQVSTEEATSATGSGATLNGTVIPGSRTATASFEYGTTTSYGSTAEADQGDLTGTAAVPVSRAITGLLPNTVYHFRAVGQNKDGTGSRSYGSDMLFSTLAVAPSVVTDAPTAVGTASATLRGTVNAQNASTAVTFEYGRNTGYGTVVSASPSPIAGGADTSVSANLSGLQPFATYHYRVVGGNYAGTAWGLDQAFTTSASAPTVATLSAGSITVTGATLNGTVNANNQTTSVSFEYGLTASYGTIVPAVPDSVSGYGAVAVSKAITGLAFNSVYHYRVIATNPAGTTLGLDMTFTTNPQAPYAVTHSPTDLTATGAVLHGTVNARNMATTILFRYGTVSGGPYPTTVAATPATLSSSADTPVSATLSGLPAKTTFCYLVEAGNAAGTTLGMENCFQTRSHDVLLPLIRKGP